MSQHKKEPLKGVSIADVPEGGTLNQIKSIKMWKIDHLISDGKISQFILALKLNILILKFLYP